MDDMDFDQVVNVPDTPDRSAARHNDGRKGSNSSTGGWRNVHFGETEYLNQQRARSRLATENGQSRRPDLHFCKNPINIDQGRPPSDSIDSSPSGICFHSRNAPLFRRAAATSNPKPTTMHCAGGEDVDKRKASSAKNRLRKPPVRITDDDFEHFSQLNDHNKICFKPPVHVDDNYSQSLNQVNEHNRIRCKPPVRIVDVDNQYASQSNEHNRMLDRAFTQSASKDVRASSAIKGKEKIDVNTIGSSGSTTNHGKAIDYSGGSQHKDEKQMATSPLCATSPKVAGQKRLVRNGCISPQNIATRTQKAIASLQVGSSDEQNQSRNVVSNGQSQVNIRDIVAEDNEYHRVKGKGVIAHPSSDRHDSNIFHLSTSSSVTNNGAADKTNDAKRYALSGGWRSTRDHAKKTNTDGCPLVREDNSGCFVNEQHGSRVVRRDNGGERGNIMDGVHNPVDQDAGQNTRTVFGLNQISELGQSGSTLSKRQKKHILTSTNHGECSTVAPDDSEILFLGSSRTSSSSRSSGVRRRQRQGSLDPLYEIDGSSSEIRNSNVQGLGMNNDDSDARAKQLEADEMLARELQEQLYNETLIFGGDEIDEQMAWALMQEEGAIPSASNRNHRISHPRSLSSHSFRQPQPRSSSNRRGTQVSVPVTRTSQSRNRLLNRSSTALSRERNRYPVRIPRGRGLQFPVSMDLDMRLDILEALEAAVGDLNDMSMTADGVINIHREFNENDYEMLSALDENISRVGATANRINSLPESVVQTDKFEETCAVCLEDPTIGETIRHLPCLHKFHKDCIDQWLQRSASCPVCKSSVN